MRYLISRNEMQKLDEDTQAKYHIPGAILMERAALSVLEELDKERALLNKVLVVCGTGNNGGDGLAVARMLFLSGIDVTITVIGNADKLSDLAKLQLSILNQYSIPVQFNIIPDKEYTTIIDALFGIGLTRDITGEYEKAVSYMNQAKARKVAIDIPSGVDADSGKIYHVAVKADLTVTFAYAKTGLYFYPGAANVGRIIVKDIGIYKPAEIKHFQNDSVIAIQNKSQKMNQQKQGNKPVTQENNPVIFTYTVEDLTLLKKRAPDSHKGTFGKLLLIAGSENMSGAAFLSASAAYRTGAGLVKIVTPESNRGILQTQIPEAILETYKTGTQNAADDRYESSSAKAIAEECKPDSVKEAFDFRALEKAIDWCDAIAIGPGIGVCELTEAILEKGLLYANKPIVIDADGLNILSRKPMLLKAHKQPVILTPHLGEMARLTAKKMEEIKASLIENVDKFAKENQVICVCKDSHSVVTDGSGHIYVNLSGNNGMATAGSGDVLTGIIAGLLVQGNSPFLSASLGSFIHGLAGDEAAKITGKTSMVARDIINNLYKIYMTKEVLENEAL